MPKTIDGEILDAVGKAGISMNTIAEAIGKDGIVVRERVKNLADLGLVRIVNVSGTEFVSLTPPKKPGTKAETKRRALLRKLRGKRFTREASA